MPDYDPKSIPVLDDIIEGESDDTTGTHEKIIISDEISADNNTLDLFNDATANIEIEQAEPELGAIEKLIDGDEELDIKAIEEPDSETLDDEQPADETEILESALIDYPHEDNTEKNLVQESENGLAIEESSTNDSNTLDEPVNQSTHDNEPSVITQPAITLDLNSIIDDVVTQMIPELEQQLRARLRLALQEKLPQEIIEQTTAEESAENNNR